MEIKIKSITDVHEQIGKTWALTATYNDLIQADVKAGGQLEQLAEEAQLAVAARRKEAEVTLEQYSRFQSQNSDSYAVADAMSKSQKKLENCMQQQVMLRQYAQELQSLAHDLKKLSDESQAVSDSLKAPAQKSRRLIKLIMEAK